MYRYPYSNDPNALGLMVGLFAPVVFLLCSLYNARRLGKFKKTQDEIPSIAHKSTRKKRRLMICCILFCVLLGAVIRFIF